MLDVLRAWLYVAVVFKNNFSSSLKYGIWYSVIYIKSLVKRKKKESEIWRKGKIFYVYKKKAHLGAWMNLKLKLRNPK